MAFTALSRQGRFAEAVPWFEKALAGSAHDLDALQGLGAALFECGQIGKAVDSWRLALRLGAETADLHDNLARGLALLGSRQEARRHRALSRRLQGKSRIGLDLLREAWEWLSGGTRRGS